MFKEKLLTVITSLQSLPELPAEFDAEVASEKEMSRQEGFAAGVASVSSPGDKVFSQEDVDAMLKPLQESIIVKDDEISVLRSEQQLKIEEAVRASKSELLMEIERDLQDAQDSENATEAEFKTKLESRKNF